MSFAIKLILSAAGLNGGDKTAYADPYRPEIADIIDLQLRIKFIAMFQNGSGLVAGDRIDSAAKGYQLNELHIGLGADVTSGVVDPALVGPLIEHLSVFFLHAVCHGILGNEDEAEGGNEVVDTVVDFRIDVVGASGHHQDLLSVGAGVGDIFLGLRSDIPLIGLVSLVGCPYGCRSLFFVYAELFQEIGGRSLFKILWPVKTKVRV